MDLLLPWFAVLAGCLALALVWGRGRRRGRAFVEVAPDYRSFFRHQKLTEPDHFLALASVIVSGHPDRHVARVTVGEGPEALTAYLKREHRVSWRTRLDSFLAGFGPCSRSLREARVLRALRRDGIGCPEWLAAGEDGRGRAFVLVREVEGAADLGAFLRAEADGSARRRTARRLGAALARLHDAGFEHPDLYTKHILVRPADGAIAFLDWQRSCRRRALSWRARGRDLAALHATLADDLATPRERLACLREYLRHEARCREVEAEGAAPARPLRQALARVQARARQLLARRHIREKRQPRPPADTQNWVCLDGEALCVTPTLADLCPGAAADWLALDRQPAPPGRAPTRRWLLLPGGRRTLLVRRRDGRPLAALWSWLRGRPLPSPEQRQAGLLFRLQRHEVPAPRVLAMGQRRRRPWQVESFLLTEPAADTVPLAAWLARPGRRTSARRALLRQAGELLHRLHEAGCYLSPRLPGCPLAVRVVAGAPPAPVLDRAEAVRACRRRQVARARRDLVRAGRALAAAGCGRSDVARFLAAYRRRTPALAGAWRRGRAAARAVAPPRPAPLPGPLPGDPISPPGPPVVNRESFWRRLLRGARRLRERPDWPLFAGADWPDRIMDVAVTDRFSAKQGRSTGRWVLHRPAANGEGRLAVYLKRHYQLPRWQGLLAALWPRGGWSPALQEWKHLEWARQQGVPVPEVVAAAEYIGPWGRLQSFLAVEELADMLPLHEAIPLAATRLDAPTFRRWKRTLVAEMARLTRMLHDRRCFHKDLYLCHFYVARDDTACLPAWRGRVFLIDLHRLTRHAWTWRLWQTKDLAQLLYSSAVPGVDARDQLSFWGHYRGAGPRRGADRWLRWFVLFKWRRYCRHNLRRRARQQQRTKGEG
ncbi:MAG TPA: lipopolysaccharide kinase InaA family protein [Gemmataceae bacterium]|jgi:heptose I phosphotransferase|nr:lipopolysaccharide kinase InaA family protein [Gemmataceae bacterium]